LTERKLDRAPADRLWDGTGAVERRPSTVCRLAGGGSDRSMDGMKASVELLRLALQEIARSLPAAQAAEVAAAIRHRVDVLADGELSSAADATLAADLAPLLRALEAAADPTPRSVHRLRLVSASLPDGVD
jgi:hypothetical protein